MAFVEMNVGMYSEIGHSDQQSSNRPVIARPATICPTTILQCVAKTERLVVKTGLPLLRRKTDEIRIRDSVTDFEFAFFHQLIVEKIENWIR